MPQGHRVRSSSVHVAGAPPNALPASSMRTVVGAPAAQGIQGTATYTSWKKLFIVGRFVHYHLPQQTTTKKLLRLPSLLHFHAFSYCSTRNRERFLFCIFISALESLKNIPRWIFFTVVDESSVASCRKRNVH